MTNGRMMMKWFVDGDQAVITKDDFVDLQESPAVFVPRDSQAGETIEDKGIINLPLGDLRAIKGLLESGGGYWNPAWSYSSDSDDPIGGGREA
jgi:hypothetical protein